MQHAGDRAVLSPSPHPLQLLRHQPLHVRPAGRNAGHAGGGLHLRPGSLAARWRGLQRGGVRHLALHVRLHHHAQRHLCGKVSDSTVG